VTLAKTRAWRGSWVTASDLLLGSWRRTLIAAGISDYRAELVLNLFARMRRGTAYPVRDDVARVLGRPPIAFRDFARDHAIALAEQAPDPLSS